MPRTRTIKETIYKFAELDPKARDRALDAARGAAGEFFSEDLVHTAYEDYAIVARCLGVTFDTEPVKLMGGGTRHDPKLYWTLHVQGAGCNFSGRWDHKADAGTAIRAHAPQDATLHRIADVLEAQPAGTCAHVKAGRETHPGDTRIDVYGEDGDYAPQPVQADVIEALRDLMTWYYRMIDAEYDYRTQDSTLAEELQDREFYKSGAYADVPRGR